MPPPRDDEAWDVLAPGPASTVEYVGFDDSSCFAYDDVIALCNADSTSRFELRPCWKKGSTTQLFHLSQYKSIVDSLLPSMKRRGHTFNLLFKERAVTSILALDTENDTIVGGITFRLTRLHGHNAIVVNVIMLAVLQEQGIAQQGTGSRLVAAATRCAMLAKKVLCSCLGLHSDSVSRPCFRQTNTSFSLRKPMPDQ
jgi:hypothetical protein